MEQGTEMSVSSTPEIETMVNDVRLHYHCLPSHLLRLWRQRLLQQSLAQEVQVIQATGERRRFGGGCASICFDWWRCHDRGETELVAI